VTADDLAVAALAHRAADLERAGDDGLEVCEVPLLAQTDIRVDASRAARMPSPLPTDPNTVTVAGDRSALWLGPDEWLVVGPAGSGADTRAELEAVLADAHPSIVDVSANRAVLELRGPGRHDLLSKGCSLDLHPRSWGAGRCAQTLLARVPVILEERPDATRVYVRPSFGDYLVDWILDALAPA
jgi:sarcosine oxidase, subunit gamma